MKKVNKQIKGIFRIILLVLVASLVGVGIYNINATRLAGNSLPMPLGFGAAVVLSGSMEPEFSVGDLLIVTEKESYKVGDVVVFQDDGMTVTHRIVSITEEEIVTKGDANNSEDSPITREQIKGSVLFAVPFLGYLINVIKTPIGILALFALAFFLLERSFRSEKKNDKQKLDDIRAEIEKLKEEQNKNL